MSEAKAEQRVRVVKWREGEGAEESVDVLAAEEPLEIRVEGKAISVTMRTPGRDEELAAGFLLSEGLIKSRQEIASVGPCAKAGEGNVVEVRLRAGLAVDVARLTRHVFASSSCGICGKATIDSVRQGFAPIQSAVKISAATLLTLPGKLREAQATFSKTGGLHAAGIFDRSGKILVLREDVGRHNALDKVLGYALLNGISLDQAVLLVSGRTSFEIMQKALAGRVPIVAAISAPSSLAAEFAEEAGQTLVGFLRDGRFNLYAHPQRIALD
ncbi:MAG TPA: formate dehydrogenase accessory sulfurtransferase FdhD [Tepidisphaeraceae bacterium]|nr:formate dehydrogenase accessory sulfurtransferase FdhD [Tepidisphaeraceae bacterium]